MYTIIIFCKLKGCCRIIRVEDKILTVFCKMWWFTRSKFIPTLPTVYYSGMNDFPFIAMSFFLADYVAAVVTQ